MTEHSLLGASSAYRWLNCPGSFKLSQTAPHRPSSIYAATGTLAHTLIEQAAGNRTRYDGGGIGQNFAVDGQTVTVDQDLLDGVNTMLEYFEKAALLSSWNEVEFRVDLADYFLKSPPVPVFGTVDAAACTVFDHLLEVIDYKNGAGITVSAIENPQLMFYGAGVLAYLPGSLRDQVRTIKLTIVQPHGQGVSPIRSWELDVVDLLMWVDEVLVPGVEACAQDDAPLNPGTWCRFCPVSHACPKLVADAVEMAKREFDDMPEADVDHPGTEARLAELLDTAERAELWISRIREFAIDQLQHQVRIPGWGLVPTRPTRKWLYPDADIANRLSHLGAGHDEIFETRVRSPAQVEKGLHRLPRRGRVIWDQAQRLVETRSSGVKLGRDTTTAAEEDFADE